MLTLPGREKKLCSTNRLCINPFNAEKMDEHRFPNRSSRPEGRATSLLMLLIGALILVLTDCGLVLDWPNY